MRSGTRRLPALMVGLFLLGTILPLAQPPAARAAGTISLTAVNVAYTQDFDTLASTGTSSTVPNGWDFAESGTNANTTYTAGTGSSNSGDTYSFGAASDSDRAFGGLLSGSLVPTIGASFTNNTGTTVTAVAIAYVGEQWRLGATGRNDRLDFQYSTDATSLITGAWTDFDALDFVAPSGTTVGALDGNASANRATVSSTITGLSIADGNSFWLRWTDFNASGADDGLGVDDFSLTPNPAGPTDPTGVGAADPATVAPGDSTLLTVTVTPGTNPASTGIAVSADLSAIGDSVTQSFFDDGTNGDVTAGDNVFSFLATVAGSTPAGAKTMPATITDVEGRTGSASIALGVIAAADIVISKVYGGGGNAGATYANDFIELFNRSADPVSLAGWSVQYASATGTSWSVTPLSGTLLPGRRYLVQEAAGAGGTTPLPTADASGSIAMAAGAGKVALVSSSGALSGACPNPALVVDFVGYGTTASCFEGSGAAPQLTNTTAAVRIDNGCTDTDDNDNDFFAGAAEPGGAGEPFNSSAPAMPCLPTGPSGVGSASPSFVLAGDASLLTVDVSPGTFPSSTGLAVSADLTAIGGSASQVFFDDGTNGDATAGDNVFSYLATVSPATSPGTKSLPFTITDAQARSGSGSISLSVVAPCDDPYTDTYDIQGSGATTPFSGSHDTQGVVIGNYQGDNTTLRGFFIQDLLGDGDETTSDGLFVFNGGPTQTLALGDLVRVSGNVSEFQGQTQVSMASVIVCTSGHDIAPAPVTFPVAEADDGVDYLERFEGMLVELPQTLYVTEHFQLGRFGQVTMSSGARLQQPTAVVEPGAPAAAMQAANNLNRIIIDDDSQAQNPDPILFGRGGHELSASNTLRGGDTATGIVGVMNWTWAGAAASPNNWRVRPVSAMHGGVPVFQPANPRPASPDDVGGTVQVGALNLLNYFNTFTNCSNGVGGTPATSNCRGASNLTEFNRQWPKTVAAIVGMDVEVLGIMEIENDGYDETSAIADLVSRLNAATAPGTWAFIDPDAATGELNSLGTDGIRVGLLYRPADVTPIGDTAVLNSIEFVNGGDNFPRSRPSLAQAFEINGNGGVFIVDVNHFKSKSGTCDDGDTGIDAGVGGCNAVRTAAAEALVEWLATDPTGTASPDVLIVGDLNAYAMEDPIDVLTGAGYNNLIRAHGGDDAYSFVFDGQWGYLDYALGSASATGRVTGVTEWHINADEPNVLDYNTDFKSVGQVASLYADDQYRMSDHDPVIVGLDFSSAGDKKAVLAVLESLLAGADAKAARRIQTAMDQLEKSLTPTWWIDGDNLTLSEGQKVFEAEQKVVHELSQKELADNSVAEALIGVILDADRALALGEIQNAENAAGRQKDIDKARAELASGDVERANGSYEKAVERYKSAWEKARNAQR